MRDELYRSHVAPLDVLTWHEEEARFAFQNGNAVFMRNWPYPVAAMSDTSQSKVAGKFAVSPMPPSGTAPGGHSTAALGGAQLAINAYTEFPDAAYKLIAYLTAPEQMLERAQAVGQYPTRAALYDDARLRSAIAIPVDNARRAIESATPRPRHRNGEPAGRAGRPRRSCWRSRRPTWGRSSLWRRSGDNRTDCPDRNR